MSSIALATAALPPEWAEERAAWAAERAALHERIARLEQRIAWFERQLFGEKSERRHLEPPPEQLSLGAGLGGAAPPAEPTQTVAAHQRRPATKTKADGEEPALFFDPARVPVEVIPVPNPEMEGLAEDAYEVIGEKVTHRLAQRPGSYVILKYVRPLIKRSDTQTLACPPAPLEGGRADVSFLAGLVVDKFLYHLPLYRQHQRLLAAGITVSRQWLTQQVLAVALLLAPIVAAMLEEIRACRVKAMDDQCAGSAFGPPGGGARRAESQEETSRPRSRPGARGRASSRPGTSGPSGATPMTAAGATSSFSTGPRVRPFMYARGSVRAGKARCS